MVMAQDVALGAARLVRQKFGLTVLYNCIAILLAVAGLVTPLVVALAMLTSSILVVANALRLNRTSSRRKSTFGPRRAYGGNAMTILYLLIPLSLFMGLVGLTAFGA